ncbi:MAG: tetratricopeptide repeat protein [Lachnospiraceae bacterium]|nr:tetratricopeptide repeat protein [Lachnospiraceae bacterium]
MRKRLLFLVLCITLCSVILTGCSKSKKLMKEASTLVEEKRYEEAIEVYKEALELEKSNEEIYISIADAYLKIDEYNKAIDIVNEGLDEIDSEELEDKLKSIERKLEKEKERFYESDTKMLDNLLTALIICRVDPALNIPSDFLNTLVEDSTNNLKDITTWNVSDNDFTKEVAAIMDIDSYSELKDMIKSPNATGRIIVTYDQDKMRFKGNLEGTDIVIER